MKSLIFSICLVVFTGFFVSCSKSGGAGSDTTPESGSDVSSKSVEELKNEVLAQAGSCSDEIKKDYEKQIEAAFKSERGLNENQKKTLLNKMLKRIKCG